VGPVRLSPLVSLASAGLTGCHTGAADVWTYITVSRGDTDNILRSSTWTLNGFRGKDTSVVFLASKRSESRCCLS